MIKIPEELKPVTENNIKEKTKLFVDKYKNELENYEPLITFQPNTYNFMINEITDALFKQEGPERDKPLKKFLVIKIVD